MESRVNTRVMERSKEHKPNVSGKNAVRFMDEVKGEFRRITWTPKDELIVYTKVVLAMTFIFGMAVYGADLVIQGAVGTVNTLLRFIIG